MYGLSADDSMDDGWYEEDLMECLGIDKVAGVDNGMSGDAGHPLKQFRTEQVGSMRHLMLTSNCTSGFW